MPRRCWREINLNQLKENYNAYRECYSKNPWIMPVVKADAYGHGAVECAKCLQELAASNFAVSNIYEAIQLREAGIYGQILVLGYTSLEDVDKLINYDITQTIISEEYGVALFGKQRRIKCHVAIDTGMNRIGIDSDEIDLCERYIRECCEKLDVTGIFTHLCVADSNNVVDCDFTQKQIEKFKKVCDAVKDLNIPYIHCANSAAGLWYNHGGNLVRLGIVLYGLKPAYHKVLSKSIQPVLEWKSVVSMVKKVYPGEYIGYGRTFYVEHEMKVATISAGYADGYNRRLSNKGYVLIKGCKAKVVGRICMDQFMVDVTNISGVKMGDEVTLLGRSGDKIITADDMAELIGTIGYEVVCNISKRVPPIYIK